jgi:uncharacterized protein (TIGR02145 family)
LSSSSLLLSSSSRAIVVVHGDPVTDVDGQTYETVVIGNQTWIAKNLNRNVEGSKCYNDSDLNCTIYGRLYNWATVMSDAASSDKIPSGVQGICPAGFHVPSDVEWTVLTEYAGSYARLKATSGWNSSPGNGTDSYGFSALPGGYGSNNTFYNVGSNTRWWSATDNGTYAYIRHSSGRDIDSKSYLNSLRCVKDFQPSSSSSYISVSCPNVPAGSFCDDRDGKTYKSTTIGNQIWMAENLNYETEDSFCYNNSDTNCALYGRLYNWTVAMAIEPACSKSYCVSYINSPHQGICPKGWHLPTRTETNELITNASGASSAGQILKATSGWGNYNGVDALGFSALPGGYYDSFYNERYSAINTISRWWNVVYGSYSDPQYWEVGTGVGVSNNTTRYPADRYSIRCVKDSN